LRLEPFLAVLTFFVTFFLVGLWHGQTSEFLFFGVLQGLGVSSVKLYQVMLGKKRHRKLASNALYSFFCRGLTFTWFTFTLLWFWSSWTQLGAIAARLGPAAILLAFIVIWLVSCLGIDLWERIRIDLRSRYLRTVRATAMGVIATATVLLMNAPAPDIVYKAF
jgi:hypothetical protein